MLKIKQDSVCVGDKEAPRWSNDLGGNLSPSSFARFIAVSVVCETSVPEPTVSKGGLYSRMGHFLAYCVALLLSGTSALPEHMCTSVHTPHSLFYQLRVLHPLDSPRTAPLSPESLSIFKLFLATGSLPSRL